MSQLRRLIRRCLSSLRPAHAEDEATREIASHLALIEDEYRRRGMTAQEAHVAARRAFGGIEQLKDRHRDQRGLPLLDSMRQDVRYSTRAIARSPAFSAVVILALALGIGGNTVMFSVVNTLLLRPLPYRDASHLVSIETIEAAHGSVTGTSPPDFFLYRSHVRTLEHLAAYYRRPFNLTGDTDAERIFTLTVSSEFFDLLGVQPALGRGFAARDEEWGSHRVAILTDGLWRRRFGGDAGIIGRDVTLNGQQYQVIGVLPRSFSYLGWDLQAFVPLAFAPADNLNSRNNYFLAMLGRLAPGVARAQAADELNRLSDAIIADHSENKGTALRITPLQQWLIKDVRRAAVVLSIAVGLVLLTACANVANLLLARATTRRRETAVRMALGAGRARIIQQSLTETTLLALLGGAAGVVLAYWVVRAINLLSRQLLPRVEDVTIDLRVLMFAAVASVVTGVVFGLAPALATRETSLNVGLKDSARTGDRGGRRLRSVLVVAEIALSLAVLAGAGLMLRSFERLLHADIGFVPDHILTMQVTLPFNRYVDADLDRRQSPQAYRRATRFFTDAVDQIRTLPGVRGVGTINGLPLMGEIWGKYLVLLDRPLPRTVSDLPTTQYRVVAGDYFRAIGAVLLRGRVFTDADTIDAAKVAVVNNQLVNRFWPDRDPIGQALMVNEPRALIPAGIPVPADYEPMRFTVIGVVNDVHYGTVSARPLPVVYAPFAQGSEGTTNMSFVVRTAQDPRALAAEVRARVQGIDRDVPVANVETMEDRLAATVGQPRLEAIVLALFAAVALAIAAVGIYGVMSYAVSARTRELGVRMALGAGTVEIVRIVVRQMLLMVGAGTAIGTIFAIAGAPLMRALLFGVSPTDPFIFAAIVILIIFVAMVATLAPAIRAARIDPLLAIRDE